MILDGNRPVSIDKEIKKITIKPFSGIVDLISGSMGDKEAAAIKSLNELSYPPLNC